MAGRRGQGTAGGADTLTREQVLEAALELVERQGADRLTVRGLAASLSVAVTSLYWHVGDKEALLDGVAGLVVHRFGPVQVRGSDPEARLCSAARSLRSMLVARADLVGLVHRQGRTAELMQPARRVMVAELAAAGVAATDIPMATQALVTHVVGSVLLDRQVARQPAQREAAESLWRPDDLPDQPELLAALAKPVDDHRVFDYSLRVLVHAIVTG